MLSISHMIGAFKHRYLMISIIEELGFPVSYRL